MEQFGGSENPITRRRGNTTLAVYALALNVTYGVLHAHETGRVKEVSPALLAGIAALGHDPGQVTEEYAAWRREQQTIQAAKLRLACPQA